MSFTYYTPFVARSVLVAGPGMRPATIVVFLLPQRHFVAGPTPGPIT